MIRMESSMLLLQKTAGTRNLVIKTTIILNHLILEGILSVPCLLDHDVTWIYIWSIAGIRGHSTAPGLDILRID